MPRKRKKHKSKETFYKDMAPALILPVVMAVHLYGARALLITALSVLSALLSEAAGSKFIGKKPHFRDMSSVYTGVLLALMMPASVPLWMPIAGSAFAVLTIKIPFGGAYRAPFSCAAAAFSFLSICRPDAVFAYPALESNISDPNNFVEGVSLASSLGTSGNPGITAVELINAFIGSVPGAMGMTSAVIMLGILIYIFVRRPKSFKNSLGFLSVCLVGAVLVTAFSGGRIFSENSLRLICVRLFSGFTMGIAVFLITEEGPSPKKKMHRFLYGALAGAIYIALRYVSVFEDAGCFAVLTVNAVWPLLNGLFIKKENKTAEVIRSE